MLPRSGASGRGVKGKEEGGPCGSVAREFPKRFKENDPRCQVSNSLEGVKKKGKEGGCGGARR